MAMIKQQAVTAVHRFGYAARPGELMAAQADPQGWLLSNSSLPVSLVQLPGRLSPVPKAASRAWHCYCSAPNFNAASAQELAWIDDNG